MNAKVTLDPDKRRIEVDLRDNIDVLPCGLNVSEACARTAALIGIFNGLESDIPKNAGSFGHVDILIRDHSVIGGGHHPASFSVSTTNLADRVVAAVQLAMGTLCATSAVAEVGAVNPPTRASCPETIRATAAPTSISFFLAARVVRPRARATPG